MPSFSQSVMNAAFAFVLADEGRIRAIARACNAQVDAITGPAVEMVAALIDRGDDPAANIGLVVDACRRELMPRGVLIDPGAIRAHDEPIRDYMGANADTNEPDYQPDERHSRRTGRRWAQKRRIAREHGQFGFCGLAFRNDYAHSHLNALRPCAQRRPPVRPCTCK